jgi:hypothetical protein
MRFALHVRRVTSESANKRLIKSLTCPLLLLRPVPP